MCECWYCAPHCAKTKYKIFPIKESETQREKGSELKLYRKEFDVICNECNGKPIFIVFDFITKVVVRVTFSQNNRNPKASMLCHQINASMEVIVHLQSKMTVHSM